MSLWFQKMLPAGVPATTGWQPVLPRICGRNVVKPFLASCDGLRGFHFCGVFTEARLAIAPGAVMECLLRLGDIRRIALPSFKHRSLQRAAERKTQLPWQIRQTIHGVEMFGGLLIALTT